MLITYFDSALSLPALFLPRASCLQAVSSREITLIQVSQCSSHMGTKFCEVVCDEHGIGGSGEHCGDIDAHLGRISVFYHGASGGKSAPRAVLLYFEPGVIGAVPLSRRSANSSAPTTSWTIRAGENCAKGHYKKLNTSHISLLLVSL
jgi:hypothetical protein